MPDQLIENRIIAETNQCVACGLCLPHCPTYRLLQSEADSPRGRIALMNGVVTKRIPMNTRFIEHMDRCLTCRACEAVCPNQVAYGDLIDQMRALIAQQEKSQNKARQSQALNLLVRFFLHRPKRLELLRRLFYFAQRYNGLYLLGRLNRLFTQRLFKFMTQLPLVKFPCTEFSNERYRTGNAWREIYPAIEQERGRVGLFLGCVARLTDVETLNASIYVLNRLGYTVHIPSAQTCCGAIDRHHGAFSMAETLAQQNRMAFSTLNIEAVITTASGCGVQLLESGLANDRIKVMDINHFLATAMGWDDLEIAPLPQKILVHEPCTLRNVFRSQQYQYQLIAKIPGAQPLPMADNDQCCGAAGSYFIEQPELAERLLENKLTQIDDKETTYLVTANIGCAMFIANGLLEKGFDIKIMHSVTLLARQMGLQL